MRVVVNPDGDERVIASNVDFADSFLTQTIGLMGRASIPEDYALVFEFDGSARRFIHMLFVRFSLDVVWTLDGEVVQVKQLHPWTGVGMAKSDRIIELPAGAADGVEIGEPIDVVEESTAAEGEPNRVADAIDEAVEGETATESVEADDQE